MRHSRPVFAALAVLALGSWASSGFACEDKAKAAAAAAAESKSSACTAVMAAKCTPEMAAACRAKGMSAAAMTGCTHASKAAQSGKSGCQSGKNSGVNAFMAGSERSNGSEVKFDAVVAGAGAGCKHASAAAAAGDGAKCSGHGVANWADRSSHTDCDACSDMAFCDGEVREQGATVQIVPLKNGVMYVYTAEGPNRVHAVQASMGRRNDRMQGILAAGDKAHLCSSCKSVRGAIASGKLNRELVNIEGGCLTLMTSNDPAMVAKIYSLAGLKGPMSIKS